MALGCMVTRSPPDSTPPVSSPIPSSVRLQGLYLIKQTAEQAALHQAHILKAPSFLLHNAAHQFHLLGQNAFRQTLARAAARARGTQAKCEFEALYEKPAHKDTNHESSYPIVLWAVGTTMPETIYAIHDMATTCNITARVNEQHWAHGFQPPRIASVSFPTSRN
jgi:hypothetical protein